MGIPKSNEIIHLGFVSEQDKFDALDASRFLIMPSFYESLSMVTLEAFFTKTPVLANGRCLVLKDLCRKSNGGLYYTNYAEFSECLNFMLENNGISRKLGRQGAVFAEMNYNWDTIENKFLKLINQLNTQ
jgi:glycosyltransferase involved in cell wall biosynthesis